MKAGNYPRRVLLTVSGLSPQIITETLYALAVAAQPADRFVPTEVVVLTTTEGAQRIRLALLSEQPGGFRRLLADYGLPPILFDERQLHVVHDAEGQPLADIRTEADNALMADAITELVRSLTADEDCALHVSMAGGRKTMGYYAGYALSLFGREQDRLSHVLVSAPFESSWEFCYPTPEPRVISVAGGRELADASTALVSLAQIPFVRLRQGLPQALLQGSRSFVETVQVANASKHAPHMRLDPLRCELHADAQVIKLPPTQFALLAVLAQRAISGKPPLAAPLRDAHDQPWADEVLADLRAAVGLINVSSSVQRSLQQECSGAKVSPHFSRLRKRLAACLAPGRAALYFDDGDTHRHRRYRVPLPAAAVEFIDGRAS